MNAEGDFILDQGEWQEGDTVLFPVYEFDPETGEQVLSGFEERVYTPGEGIEDPWVVRSGDDEEETPPLDPIVDVITTPTPTPTPTPARHAHARPRAAHPLPRPLPPRGNIDVLDIFYG